MITVKQGDTFPIIEQTLAFDGALDLTGATVTFRMYNEYHEIVTEESSDTSTDIKIIDAESGKVEYSWQQSDTENVGSYHAEWQVDYPSSDVVTVPNDGFIDVEVHE